MSTFVARFVVSHANHCAKRCSMILITPFLVVTLLKICYAMNTKVGNRTFARFVWIKWYWNVDTR